MIFDYIEPEALIGVRRAYNMHITSGKELPTVRMLVLEGVTTGQTEQGMSISGSSWWSFI